MPTFSHHPQLWQAFPLLSVGVVHATRVHALQGPHAAIDAHLAVARQRLTAAHGDQGSEGQWPEIQAWRRAFAQMGLKPTQVRCAAEALLRRLRKEGGLPRLHPLVDLCNALSVRFAVPVAVFDVDRVAWPLLVRAARGDETHETFAGENAPPEPGEIVFADARGHAHARRWAHRQSRRSAVQAQTTEALIVAEALHAEAASTIDVMLQTLRGELTEGGAEVLASARLSADRPLFELQPSTP
jgi:DNA/RNA-binding domain of Phe-tRNA-synthetase-like protein